MTLFATDLAHARLLRVIDDPRFEQGAGFGRALAAVASDVAVGVPGARVFDRDRAGLVRILGSDGVLRRTFEARTPVEDAAFGSMVVAREGLLYVSAPGDRSIGLAGVGAIYVFDVATGALVRIVRAPDPAANTLPVGGALPPSNIIPPSTTPPPEPRGFGRALVITGDRILVGAPDSVVEGLDGAGAAYLFDGQGTLIRTLREFSPHSGASFGASLTVVGNVLFVGVPGAPAGGVERAGVVRAFDIITGRALATLRPAFPSEGAAFGAVVGEVDGGLFVGAPGDRALGVDGAGAVYLFDLSDTDTGRLRAVITPPTPAPSLGFGRAVAVFDGNLLVGADGGGPAQSGEAFLIDPVTSVLRATFAPTNPRAGGRFGFALAAVGRDIVIGEPALEVTSGSGRVHLFDLTAGTPGARPSRAQGTGGTQAAPLPASCPEGPTTPSVDCRLSALLGTVEGAGVQSLARPLRQVRRAVERADRTHDGRRTRAFRRALHGVGEFVDRLGARRAGRGISAEVRDSWLAAASSLQADLGSLLGSTTP